MKPTSRLSVDCYKGYAMQNASMARPKKHNTDRHKPSRMTRIRGRLADQLQKLVDRNETDFTSEVNRAVRELLEREQLWPPPGKPAKPD